MEGIVATSYSAGDKFYIDPSKLLPLARFLPQPKYGLFASLCQKLTFPSIMQFVFSLICTIWRWIWVNHCPINFLTYVCSDCPWILFYFFVHLCVEYFLFVFGFILLHHVLPWFFTTHTTSFFNWILKFELFHRFFMLCCSCLKTMFFMIYWICQRCFIFVVSMWCLYYTQNNRFLCSHKLKVNMEVSVASWDYIWFKGLLVLCLQSWKR